MDRINKLSLPSTIIISCLILGGFYFAVERTKQRSIEKQQEIRMTKEAGDAVTKRLCVAEAEQGAVDFYKQSCTYNCKEGQYYIATYNANYRTCLQRAGLE